MSKIKKLAGETAIYGISTILGRAIQFLLVPFYTHKSVLSVEEYGISGTIYSYIAFFMVVYTYGMETAFFRYSTKYDFKEKQIYNTTLTAIIFSSILFSSVIILLAQPIANWLEVPNRDEIVIWCAIILGIDAIMSIPFAQLRQEKKSKEFATYKLINILLNVGLNLFFLLVCKNIYHEKFMPQLKPLVAYVYNPNYNVEYIFISNLIANAAYLPMFRRKFMAMRISIDREMLRSMLVYAFPIMVMSLANIVNDKLTIAIFEKILPDSFYPNLNSKEATGVLNAALKLSMIMTLGIQAFRYAAEPFFFSESKNENAKESYASVFYYFAIFGSFLILAISLNLDIIKIPILRNPTYYEGLYIVPILLIANLFIGLSYNFSIWYKVTDKTKFGTIIALSGAVITIVGSYILIPLFGYLGSAITTLFVYFFIMAATYIIGQKHYPVNYSVYKVLPWFLGSIILIIVGMNLPITVFWLKQGIMEVFIIVYGIALYNLVFKKIRLNKN